MTSEIIDKQVDLYNYPTEFEDSLGSITIGDLHGNAVKFVHFLLRHNVIKFNDTITDPAQAYSDFVNLYEQSNDIATICNENKNLIAAKDRIIKHHQASIDKYHLLNAKTDRSDEETRELSELNLASSTRWLEENKAEKTLLETALTDAKNKLREIVPQFNQFINKLEIKNPNTLVRLIGDELADRGSNDYFTLRLLGFLNNHDVKVNITISNHSNEFITAYENLANTNDFKPQNDITDKQKPSFLGLKLLLDQGHITHEEITTLVDQAYKPNLKIIDYTLDAQGIRLFTHAPVAFDIIEKIANRMGVAYNDSSKETLAATIDKINTKFEQAVKDNKIHELCNNNEITDSANMTPEQITKAPLTHIIWNRFNKEKDTEEARPASKNGYMLRYTHGHDDYQSLLEQVDNLDTSSGKEPRKALKNKIIMANQAIADNAPDKAAAEAFLKSLNQYKVLNSDETGLNQKHDPALIDLEFLIPAANTMRTKAITGTLAGIGLALGAALGMALIATGVFAPFGVGLLGIIALAATLGGGLAAISGAIGFGAAKATAVPTSTNTLLPEQYQVSHRIMKRLLPSISEAAQPTVDVVPSITETPEAPPINVTPDPTSIDETQIDAPSLEARIK